MEMKNDLNALLDICRQGGRQLRLDSRKVDKGDIFVAVPGATADGTSFIPDAAARGAEYIVCGRQHVSFAQDLAPDAKVFGVDDPRKALGILAQALYATDNVSLKILGITGTNGKTTCAWLLEHLSKSLGHAAGMLGTIEYRWPGHKEDASLTTPEAPQLHAMLDQMRKAGVDDVIMEVSSHALQQHRVAGINFSGAIFTNLTQDHLDFHREMENYFRAKARLFLKCPYADKAIVINSDDKYGRRLLELLPHAHSYGLHGGVPGRRHLQGRVLELTPSGMRLAMDLGDRSWDLRSRLVGEFNAMNLLAVQALALELGVAVEHLKALESFTGVPGRLERVPNARDLHIFVDYAHTPDALINALKALRGAGFKRIVTVFGCGGNRDRDKRPLMGKAVADNSDVAILTSDNPRHEKPEAIMRDVKPGLTKCRHALYEMDRRAATARAIQLLGPEDALLIAGKGHENYQIIGDEKRHYSDQEVAAELAR